MLLGHLVSKSFIEFFFVNFIITDYFHLGNLFAMLGRKAPFGTKII